MGDVVAYLGETRGCYKVLVAEPAGKSLLLRSWKVEE
jgi:hypothetical protein